MSAIPRDRFTSGISARGDAVRTVKLALQQVTQTMLRAVRHLRLLCMAGLYLIACAACVAPPRPATDYIEAAKAAQREGRWADAARHWHQAIAVTSPLDRRQLATINYEEGRALGVMCQYDEARKALRAAHSLDKEINGPAYMPLFEMGRMYLVQERYADAADLYRDAFALAEPAGALKQTPLDAADLWEEYALALERSGEDASEAEQRARRLREAHPAGKHYTDRTPYGSHCHVGGSTTP